MNQCEKIYAYLEEHGSITPYEAFLKLRITKLATRISEMKKDGIEFGQNMESKMQDGKKISYMRYWLKEGQDEQC